MAEQGITEDQLNERAAFFAKGFCEGARYAANLAKERAAMVETLGTNEATICSTVLRTFAEVVDDLADKGELEPEEMLEAMVLAVSTRGLKS
jgi:hypothetical protein